ncbi:MerR family transcriptional regulator [Pararhizobium sp. IMCC21322]|uniref:MerR family transcriptional regulator n=1 Tax=Pararhizobium sp. IMCC21322 TaxID=3067903 RepID=UPI002741025E|nr:MerR family transcriptional regulator [Pararhizobium sp. IMCC21322]
MQIQELANRLGVSQRTLRHYEATGLLNPERGSNGYRVYNESDFRRAERVRDLIATGFSTREILAMAPCLSDDGAGACEGGLADLQHKREQIDRLIAELESKREAVTTRMDSFAASLRSHPNKESKHHATSPPDTSIPDRLSRRR